MRHVVLRRVAMAGALAGGALAVGGATVAAAHTGQSRLAIADTHPAWAVAGAQTQGQAVRTGTVNARVYLAGRDLAGLTAYAKAVSTPGNALYAHFLTASQLQARFGPTAGQVQAVETWVRSAGLTVTGVDAKVGGYVAVRGSVAAASRAFSVGFGMYASPNGKRYRAPDRSASAPSAVASAVLTIGGLDTAPHLARPMTTKLPPPPPNYWVAGPCSSYYGQKIATKLPTAYGRHAPWNVCGYTQKQIRSAYGVSSSGMTGKGQTVAIIDAYASPTMPGDANTFAKVTGDQPFKPGQYRQYTPKSYSLVGPNQCDAAGWYGEETLDIEAVHGQAPDANVHFVAAASCSDEDLANALALVVDNHLASIVSNSWGNLESDLTLRPVYEVIFKAGAAEGIGFYFSSGDSGYESPAEDPGYSSHIQVDYPTSSNWVTSVGGTSLAIGKTANYAWETSWGTLLDPLTSGGTAWQYPPPGQYPAYYDGSGGGGVSTQYTQPFYQAGVVPSSLSHHLPNGTTSKTAMRVVPDVSALADPSTGMLVGETSLMPDGKTYAFALSRIGGTSVACPVFAGIEADAQQAAGHALGFANPAIYLRYGTAAFHDVTDHPFGGSSRLAEVRNNYTNPYTKQGPLITWLRTLGINGEGAAALPAVKGYDDSTGVGSPNRYVQSFEH